MRRYSKYPCRTFPDIWAAIPSARFPNVDIKFHSDLVRHRRGEQRDRMSQEKTQEKPRGMQRRIHLTRKKISSLFHKPPTYIKSFSKLICPTRRQQPSPLRSALPPRDKAAAAAASQLLPHRSSRKFNSTPFVSSLFLTFSLNIESLIHQVSGIP